MRKRDLQVYDGVKKSLDSEAGHLDGDVEQFAVSIPERIAISREKSELFRDRIESLKRQMILWAHCWMLKPNYHQSND